LLISANRHLDAYAAFGLPVLADAEPDFKGPLAGLLAGLDAAQESEWLLCTPCDTPRLPLDLAARLAAARGTTTRIVMPRSADGRLQPLHALVQTSLRESLALALAAGQRRVLDWMQQHEHRVVEFGDGDDFSNLNSAAQLQAHLS
jgi:molybdopterin-guanine dinucleotide biosynthesis protein A